MLRDEPGSHELGEGVERFGNYSLAEVEDGDLDLCGCPRFVTEDWDLVCREVGDWNPGLRFYDGQSLQDVEYSLNYSMDCVKAADSSKVSFGSYVASFLLEPYLWMLCGVTPVLLCWRASALMMIQQTNMKKKKESRLRTGHLSFTRKKRWNGNLGSRFESRLQMKSFYFSCYGPAPMPWMLSRHDRF